MRQQTRPHRDLDLAIDAEHEVTALRALRRRCYTVETDWRPVRVELVALGRGWVDLHPVVFASIGHGRQAGVDGGYFDYLPEAFDEGELGGVVVLCLSRQQQIEFHNGYEPHEVDLDDLRVLTNLGDGS